MRRILLNITLLLCTAITLQAQTTEDYLSRYNMLVSRVGYDGIGVETLLDKWEAADPVDINHMLARFNFWLSKAVRDSVVTSSKPNYLGLEPLLSTKDSTGRSLYYFNEPLYDPLTFDKAISYLDKALEHDNGRLDIMLTKADALVSYEKEIPDSSTDFILKLVDLNFSRKAKWDCPSVEVTEAVFFDAIEHYCITFFNIGSPAALEAMFKVSSRVVKSRPAETRFINFIGAYYVKAKKDDKKALKYYRQSLKLEPENAVAQQNVNLIQRRMAASKKK